MKIQNYISTLLLIGSLFYTGCGRTEESPEPAQPRTIAVQASPEQVASNPASIEAAQRELTEEIAERYDGLIFQRIVPPRMPIHGRRRSPDRQSPGDPAQYTSRIISMEAILEGMHDN